MSDQEILFWIVVGTAIASIVFTGITCWQYFKEVDQCHK